MIQALRSRWVTASIATFIYWLTTSMLQSFVPLRMQELGHADIDIGIAVAGRSALPFLLAVAAGQLADRIGGFRLLIPSAIVMTGVGPLHGIATQPWHFTALQALFGLSCVGVWLPLQSVITHAGEGETLRQNLALFSLVWGAGVALGPALGAFVYDTMDFVAFSWVYTAITAVILATAWAIPWYAARDAERASPPREPFRRAFGSLLHRPAIRAVLLSSFVTHYMNSIRQSFYPVMLERNGFSISQIGLLLSIMGFASLVIRAFMPLISRRVEVGPMLVWSTVGGVVAISLTPALGHMWLLIAAAIVLGCQIGMNPPITIELMARFSTPTERGLAAGIRTTVNRFAQTAQPVVFGGMAAVVGLVAAFPASFGILGAMTYGMMRSIRHVRPEQESV